MASVEDNFQNNNNNNDEEHLVCKKFEQIKKEDPDIATAVAAIRALTEMLVLSQAGTMMELNKEINESSKQLQNTYDKEISLSSGVQIFIRYVTRTYADIPDFNEFKNMLISRGQKFAQMTTISRQKISNLASSFIKDGMKLLVHGESKVVAAILTAAAADHKRFTVFVTECRPDGSGYSMMERLAEVGIQGTLIMDSAVAHTMDKIDSVIVGAEAVVENGGIINRIGTYQIAMVAHALNKPLYVGAESFKFNRVYPLNQSDLPLATIRNIPLSTDRELPEGTIVLNPANDYTPPKFIRLLFTDLGILTPSAVSDELIKLYN
eukprot:TRINITY_DN107_c0_g1_i1.p2 TRINITY_DN107_c0_g1~~TRINITY_DN107_c0_g1_i1.p2  ORF type:complete len:322 (+),score=122.20 TRINITY_DN107_c0_g1_i1:1722-2687(+)